jgi:hypothetical protein
MTRTSASLFCLALWTLTPGCLQLPWRGSPVIGGEGPTKIEEPAAINFADSAKPQQIVHSPDVLEPSFVNAAQPLPALPVLITPPSPEGEGANKRPSGGVVGVVTVEPDPAQLKSVPAIFEGLPKGDRKLSALARAIDLLQNDKHAEAIDALREYDAPTQEFFLRMGPVLVQIAKTSIDKLSSQEIANLNEQLLGVLNQLRTRSKLVVTKMLYCKDINGFGDYMALPDDHVFLSRRELVQVYVELKNFASVKTKEGDFLTKLTCSLEVYDKNNKSVSGPWTIDKTETTYRRSACLNDYYGNYSFYVPALPEGTYRLAIQIVDETIPEHRRVARESLVFRVTPVANPLSSR